MGYQQIETIEKGCLLCGGDIKGNRQMKYFCKGCNMLFSYEALVKSGVIKKEVPHVPPIAKACASFFGSSKRMRVHSCQCLSVKKINPANRVTFMSLDDALDKGYSPCKRCVK